ncbi:hypothetical protein, partial [Staphylococcus aureus]
DQRMKPKSSGKVSRNEMIKDMNKNEGLDNNPVKDALKNLD